MNSFLPKSYEVPSSSDKYMKFKADENRFRILASPIVGWLWWVETGEGRKPMRVHMNGKVPVEFAESTKHFWAMPVWNYAVEKVQILEITQSGIQRTIKSLSADEDWGSPVEYDLVVKRTGDGMETKYQVTPKPKKVLDSGIVQLYTDMHINLDALYEGKDPFAEQPYQQAESEDVADEFEKSLGGT